MPPFAKGESYNTTQDLTSVTDPEGAITSLGYDSFGNVTKVIDPLGNETTLRVPVT